MTKDKWSFFCRRENDYLYEYEHSFLSYLKLEDMGIYTAYGKENKAEEKLEELYQFGKSLE